MAEQYLWQELDANPTDTVLDAYHSNPRTDLLSLLKREPRRVLDIGCAGGATGKLLMQRYRAVELWGIEANPAMARIAAQHYHRVIPEPFDKVDLWAYGLDSESVDTVLLADVLEHMANPWKALVALRSWLSSDAQILVSLPNLRNAWILGQLAAGRFQYESSGILDITHLRFFTRIEAIRMLSETGYNIEDVRYGPDQRFLSIPKPSIYPSEVSAGGMTIHVQSEEEYVELTSLQVFIRAGKHQRALTEDSLSGTSDISVLPWEVLHQGSVKGSSVAVLLHLFYPDLWPELFSQLRTIPGAPDLYISLCSESRHALVEITQDWPSAKVILVPNRGRDIAPRLQLAKLAQASGSELLLFIHGKRSPHLKDLKEEHVKGTFLEHRDGDRWRRELIGPLCHNAAEILEKFRCEPQLGMVGPAGFWINLMPDANFLLLQQLTQKLGLSICFGQDGFFAGSMFWARVSALAPVWSEVDLSSHFEDETGKLDKTLAHAYERVFAVQVSRSGFRVEDSDGKLMLEPSPDPRPWLTVRRCLEAERVWSRDWHPNRQIKLAYVLLIGDNRGLEKTKQSIEQQWLAVGDTALVRADESGLLATLNMIAASEVWDWIAFIDAGDTLSADATFRVERAIADHPEWQVIYSDEDSLTADGEHVNPHCKPDFNIDYLRSLPYVGGLLVIRRDLFLELGGFDPAADGAEDYDLVLRAWERVGDAGIGHIAEVLYHRRQGGGHCLLSVQEILAASKAALERHLRRLNIAAEVLPGPFPPATRVRYPLTSTPVVSIVIPTRNQLPMLQRCVESVIEKTRYPHYEILIVDNDSDEPEAVKYLELLAAQEKSFGGRLRVIRHPGAFNFSAMNNRAVDLARGEYILLLNNDTAVLHEDWLDEMVSQALRPEVGIVGAKLLFPDGRIQHAGVILGLCGPAEHPFIGQPAEYRGYFGRAMLTQNLSAVTGACLLISKALYQAVGGLDEHDFRVSYNDVDLCLKVREQGKKIVFTPWAILLHEGSASQRGGVENKPNPEKEKRFAGEKMAFYRKWLPQLAFDPAYNRHLSLAGSGFLLEDQAALTWDPAWRPRPRILVHPADREGCGEYRIIAPMRALQRAGRVQGWETMRIFEPAEMERFSPESIVVQRQMEWPQIEALERHKALSRVFRVFEIDDLITNLPVKSLHKAHIHKDIAKRFRKAAGLCNRLVVATEPLAEAYRGFSDEVRIQPNCIEDAIWGGLSPRRRGDSKPRVGWAGGIGHTGDLELVADVVRDLSSEVHWVFFGLCPDALKPYVQEFHPGVPLAQYPAKLASLDLDLAIAPLEDNPFNEAKSHLRLLEYGILGYPVVCSDIFPYQGDYPVWRVANRYRDWIKTIREVLADRETLASAGDVLREYVRKHWLLESRLDDWLGAWLP